MNRDLPTYADVEAAAARLAGHAEVTPLRISPALDARTRAQVFLKCESAQRTGSFKFRGAFNALARLDATERRRGVVAFSSGNHAQAVAHAARLLGMSATIVMPADAPVGKMQATRDQGARVVTYDRYQENREAIAASLAAQQGAMLLPPFDHPDIIAGQGTAAREMLQEVGSLDAMFVPVGGGGLLSGSLIVAAALAPACRLFGVEPETGNDAQRSLRSGALVRIEVPQTIADGAQTQSLGELTFELIRRHAADILTVSDVELIETMRFLRRELGMVAEPTGCLGLAAVLAAGAKLEGQRVGVILSGGNVDAARFVALLGPVESP
jgi:threonine dehydratase